MNTKRNWQYTILDKAKSLIVPAILLLVWKFVADREWFPPMLLVHPAKVAETFVELIKSGVLQQNLWISLGRVVQGFLVGATAGFLIGTLLGLSRHAADLLAPSLRAVRQVPLLGWMPLIILWCGIGELSKIVFISIGAFFPTMLNTFLGIRGVSREYLEVGRVYQMGRLRLLSLIIVPAALPSIISGIRLSVGLSWMLVVAAELIASDSGIGQMMSNGREMFQTDIVMVGIIVIGAVGMIIDTAIRQAESGLARWRHAGKA